MPKNADLYAVLEIPKTASPDEVRKAYRKLARKYHPDRNPGDNGAAAEERFKEVASAYDVLSDPERRKQYDEFGTESLQAGFDPQRARAYRRWADTGQGFSFGGGPGSGFDFGFDVGGRPRRRRTAGGGSGFADIFEMFGGGAEEAPEAPRDLEHPIEVDFLDAIRGTTLNASVRRPVPCSECGGSGRKGRRGCSACGGSGTTEKIERLAVKIPPGVREGSRVRVSGKGGESRGGRFGHLDFVVKVRPHPRLAREGQDLLMEVPVTVREAVEGASITVPTPTGKVQLKVPAGTQSGQRLRLAGRGAPDPKGGAPGDFIVRLLVHVPPASEAVAAALRTLDEAYPGDVRAHVEI
jgi:DnaJ-class molecular chaperone